MNRLICAALVAVICILPVNAFAEDKPVLEANHVSTDSQVNDNNAEPIEETDQSQVSDNDSIENEDSNQPEEAANETSDDFSDQPQTEETSVSEPIPEEINDTSKECILNLVKAVEVDAVLKRDLNLYSDRAFRNYIKTVPKDTKVNLLRDSIESYAYIRLEDNTEGWVLYSGLDISTDVYTGKEDLTEEQKNLYVNYKNYESKTYYLVWVNIERQRVNVFLGKQGNWSLIKSFVCSSGKNETPSLNGEFEYLSVSEKVRIEDYYVRNFMSYYDTYAIHTIPFKNNGEVLDGRLGEPYSHGCIRVSPEDSNWLLYYIPKGTKIIIN